MYEKEPTLSYMTHVDLQPLTKEKTLNGNWSDNWNVHENDLYYRWTYLILSSTKYLYHYTTMSEESQSSFVEIEFKLTSKSKRF